MTLEMKRWIVAVLGILFLAGLLIVGWVEGGKRRFVEKPEPVAGGDSKACVDCHRQKSPALVAQWADSRHAAVGVSCFECHAAGDNDPDAFLHEGKRIATVPTPIDCARCHADQTAEFMASHHAKAAKFIGSLDNILGEIVEGHLAAANGCQQCHGSTVALVKDAGGELRREKDGRPVLDPLTWPNTGIGRVNLDGSLGTCTACHTRHTFSRAQARQPEVCGKCHMGPDHPQIEIYTESKHGIVYAARKAEMNLESPSWVVGRDYDAAPTCATCHMSATRNQPVTHDVGARISWTLRPVVSTKLEKWEDRRRAMQDVCSACHAPDFVSAFYRQFDGTIELYNEKFAKPAQKLMGALRAAKKITPTPFDDEIEWTFYHLWHHEGRRARMGVSMQGPDYTQWHGFFEVAHRFYFELLPKARELGAGDAGFAKALAEVEAMTEHRWLKGMTQSDIESIERFYRERYGKP